VDGSRPVALLVNSLGTGGAERTVVTLLRELIRRRVAVELVCLERTRFYSVPEGCPVTFLSGARGGEGSFFKLLMIPLYALRLKRLVRRRGFAVVQSHLYRANYVNALARRLGGRHRVQIVNGGQASLYRTKGLSGRVNLFLIRKLYPGAEVIVAKSSGMEQDLREILPGTGRISVVHNPYDLDQIRQLAREDLREPWLGADIRLVVSAGRLIPLKRQRDLVRAFAEAALAEGALANTAGRDPDLHLVFLGDGPERPALERAAAERGIAKRTHFLGNVTNPFKYLARSGCLVSASASEGFPNVLVEAMICGCPVISSDCASGPREILSPGKAAEPRLESGYSIEPAGILFAVGDVSALVRAMTLLLADRALGQRLRKAGLERSRDFRLESIGDHYCRLLAC
jgi:glycosyltransferase involved in cell wall biosynthesis